MRQRRLQVFPKCASDSPISRVTSILHNSHSKPTDNTNLSSTLLSNNDYDSVDGGVGNHSHATPVSATIRKSVSFGDTSLDISEISNSSRFSTTSTASLTPTQNNIMSASCLENDEDADSVLTSESVGVDPAVQERLNKLMESIETNNHRKSVSFVEKEVAITPKNSTGGCDQVRSLTDTYENNSTHVSIAETDICTAELSEKVSFFEEEEWFNFDSKVENQTGTSKGIMDVSLCEFRNSDSDD